MGEVSIRTQPLCFACFCANGNRTVGAGATCCSSCRCNKVVQNHMLGSMPSDATVARCSLTGKACADDKRIKANVHRMSSTIPPTAVLVGSDASCKVGVWKVQVLVLLSLGFNPRKAPCRSLRLV